MRLSQFGLGVMIAATLFYSQPGHTEEAIDWNGFYSGLTAGAAVGTAKMSFSPSGLFNGPLAADIADGNYWRGQRDLDATGFTGGVYGGYQQTYGNFLFGIEADIGYLGLNESSSTTATVPASGNTYRLDQEISTDFFASLRPRVGYFPDALAGKLLVFATGGPTLTRADVTQTFTQLNNAYWSQGLSESKLLPGWAIGGGMEYALTKQWSLKAEYLYADLGSIENNNASGNTGFAAYSTDNKMDLTSHIFRLGATFHY